MLSRRAFLIGSGALATAAGLELMLSRRLLMSTAGAGSFTVPAPTFPPTDDSWTRSPDNPILVATEAWEQATVVEPCVLWDATNGFRMWYRGGWDDEAIGYANCPVGSDPTDPLNWTKSGADPIVGQGEGPESGDAAQPWVYIDGGTHYLYYTQFTGDGNMYVTTSADGLTGWSARHLCLALPATVPTWGNRSVWKEGGTWYMLAEAFNPGGWWQVYLLSSADGLDWADANGGTALSSMQPHFPDGSYSAPRIASVDGVPTPTVAGTYHVWLHGTAGAGVLPTNIYHAEGSSKTSWSLPAPNPVFTHLGSSFEVDQVAGACPLVVGATSYLFYDGDDNTGETASIGVATA